MSIQPETAVIPVFTLGDRLRKAREVTGLNQSEFARDLGMSQKSINNAERDAVKVKRATIMAWSMRTGVPVAWLENEKTPPSPDGDDGVSRNGSEEPGRSSEPWAPRDLNPQPAD